MVTSLHGMGPTSNPEIHHANFISFLRIIQMFLHAVILHQRGRAGASCFTAAYGDQFCIYGSLFYEVT